MTSTSACESEETLNTLGRGFTGGGINPSSAACAGMDAPEIMTEADTAAAIPLLRHDMIHPPFCFSRLHFTMETILSLN